MSTGTIAYEHLDCSEEGRPVIAGKRFKVIHLIREHVAYGWSAEELAINHPQLTLGEIYCALAYYASKWIERSSPAGKKPIKCTANRDIGGFLLA